MTDIQIYTNSVCYILFIHFCSSLLCILTSAEFAFLFFLKTEEYHIFKISSLLKYEGCSKCNEKYDYEL